MTTPTGVLSTLPVVLFATRVMNVTVCPPVNGPANIDGAVIGAEWP